ncbi:MAG: sensor histidine kinase, partial [Deltaproteobacteria bacterium]|nr:sensor histidine kinase [Deltaproteobacteria bacterium]
VNTKTQAARQLLSTGHEAQAEAHLKELEDVAQDTYADVREAILGLRSTDTHQRGMVSTLKDYIFRFSQMSNIRAELQIGGRFTPLSTTTEFQVIRIIQEALTNVRKHAQASHAWVRISTEGDQVEVVIEDDGQGFDVSHIRRGDWPRFGLQTMRERAESVRGSLDIKSAHGQGTKVTLRVPKAQGEGT